MVGSQLDMADAAVWLHLLDLGLRQRAEDITAVRLVVDESLLLHQLGRAKGTSNREWLYESLSRLSSNIYRFKTRDLDIENFMLLERDMAWPAERSHAINYSFKLNSQLVPLFQYGWTPLRKEVLTALGSDSLALWLYGVLVRWSGNYPPTAAYLQSLSGRVSMRSDHYLKSLAKSLAILKSATQWKGLALRDGVVVLPEKPKRQVKDSEYQMKVLDYMEDEI
ncbi:hypothetical protein [Aquitalea denitrificans]|uniref:hypothetical protein n=1 Tax=Aquitalea denitrificans TaxID=519081 RepID=UPI00135BDF30|nr:hypothetical protein [Aquitalea denitrificans]